MKIFDRYLFAATAASTLIVMSVLLGLFSFLLFADELGRTRGDYATAEAFQFVLMGVPRLAYQVFPPAAMLGTLMGLGALATHSELTAMRASGLSIQALLRPLMLLAAVLMFAMFALGEWVAPKLDRQADLMKTMAKQNRVALAGREGLWLKTENVVFHLDSINRHGEFENVSLYILDQNKQIQSIDRAKTMLFRPPRNWILREYTHQEIKPEGGVITTSQTEKKLSGLLSPELVDLLAVDPQIMSVFSLNGYIQYLKENNINSYAYELSLWSKILAPLAIPVMMLLAIPFVMGSVRTISIGHRILLGTLFGLVFHIASQAMNYIALVQQISPLLSAAIPIIVFLSIAGVRFRKVF